MYDDLVKALRFIAKQQCRVEGEQTAICDIAADAIEELMRFAHFVAREVVVSDEKWELNNLAFPKIICRKLNNLGVVSKAGELWHYEPPKEGE